MTFLAKAPLLVAVLLLVRTTHFARANPSQSLTNGGVGQNWRGDRTLEFFLLVCACTFVNAGHLPSQASCHSVLAEEWEWYETPLQLSNGTAGYVNYTAQCNLCPTNFACIGGNSNSCCGGYIGNVTYVLIPIELIGLSLNKCTSPQLIALPPFSSLSANHH